MRYKVYIDTNVLVSASISAASEDLSIKIKHQFADICIRLFDFLNKHIRKRVGIVTYIIEEEAQLVLSRAVKNQLTEEIKDRKIDFEITSILQNICENRMRIFLQSLSREPVDNIEISQIYQQVEDMYTILYNEAVALPKPASFKTSLTPGRLRKLAFQLYRSQDQKVNAQLLHLLQKPVEESDMRILAHAVYLLKVYQQVGSDIRVFLASCDYHFSPIRRAPITSRQVTEYIDTKFGIECDYPDQIFSYLNNRI